MPPSTPCPVVVAHNCSADARSKATAVRPARFASSSLGISYSDVTNSGCGGSYTILRTWDRKGVVKGKAVGVGGSRVHEKKTTSMPCPAGVTLNYPADTRTNATGGATATDTFRRDR